MLVDYSTGDSPSGWPVPVRLARTLPEVVPDLPTLQPMPQAPEATAATPFTPFPPRKRKLWKR